MFRYDRHMEHSLICWRCKHMNEDRYCLASCMYEFCKQVWKLPGTDVSVGQWVSLVIYTRVVSLGQTRAMCVKVAYPDCCHCMIG